MALKPDSNGLSNFMFALIITLLMIGLYQATIGPQNADADESSLTASP